MTYPRMLNLDEATKTRLVSYIYDELTRHHQERQQMVDELMQWQSDYWAKPSLERRTFPFLGAANIIVPLTAIAYETIHARSITTHFAVTPFTSVKARRADFQQIENPLENFMQFELLHEVGARRPIDDCLAELEKFGTGIGKVGYERIVRKAVRPSPTGTGEEEIAVVVKDGSTLDPVPNANFLMPFYAKDPQTAPWCGEIHTDNPYRVKQLEEGGLFYEGTMKSLEQWIVGGFNAEGQNSERKYERHLETLEKRVAHWPKLLIWDELWCTFNVDGDTQDEEIVIYFHEPSLTLMGARYNWHSDLHRPYRVGNYIRVENRWRGIGICKQNEQFQRSLTTQHRQRLDNATIANMRMFKVHRMSGYGPKEPIFPGKMWFLDDMSHVESLEIGDVRQSSFMDEQATLIYSQQRTKVNELVLGMPQQGTPGTATGDLARIKEGQLGFDYVFQNEKLFISELCMDVLASIHQFGTRHVEYFKYAEGGDLLIQLFQMPMSLIRESILFEVGAAGQQQNRVLDRQNWIQVAQIIIQYYTSMIQLAQMTQDPQIMQIVTAKAFTASTEAMRQILESFDIRNVDRMVLTELEKLFNGNGNGNGGTPNAAPSGPLALPGPRGVIGPPGSGQASGMDALAQTVALLRGNGAS